MGQEKNNYLVGVQYDTENNVVGIFKVCNLNKTTFTALTNKHNEYLAKKQLEQKEMLDRIAKLEEDSKALQDEIKLLKGEE